MSWAVGTSLAEDPRRFGLSPRLTSIAELIGNQAFVDVGCDHAQLPIALVSAGRVSHARAVDLNAQPIALARQSVLSSNTCGKVEVVQADGFSEAATVGYECAVMAGVGGRTLGAVIDAAPQLPARLILQANDSLSCVREAVRQRGYTLTSETWVVDAGRLFLTMVAEPGVADWGPAAVYLGPCLVGRPDRRTAAWLEIQRRHLIRSLRNPAARTVAGRRLAWVRSEQIEHAGPIAL